MTKHFQDKIKQGSDALGLTLSDEQCEKLAAYIALLDKWNKVYNLTSVRDPQEMISRHLLDSLAILPYLEGDTLLDVGSGGGLPGIPIAIVKPEIAVTLLDSNSKKTRFLQQAKAELGLTNVNVVHARIEQADLPTFSIVTARAFSTITDILDLAGRHCDDAGYLLLMKGVFPQQELDDVTGEYDVKDVVSLDIPDCDGQRHIVRIVKNKG